MDTLKSNRDILNVDILIMPHDDNTFKSTNRSKLDCLEKPRNLVGFL